MWRSCGNCMVCMIEGRNSTGFVDWRRAADKPFSAGIFRSVRTCKARGIVFEGTRPLGGRSRRRQSAGRACRGRRMQFRIRMAVAVEAGLGLLVGQPNEFQAMML